MDYFPIFVAVNSRQVLLVGAGEDCVHKARLVMKSSAMIHVFHDDDGVEIAAQFQAWQDQGKVIIHQRMVEGHDCHNAAFAFIGTEHEANRLQARAIFDDHGLLYAFIDNKAESRFITPALVDRDPVVVAIGTEGTGPIIARDIKAKIESLLHPETGIVAKAAGLFRPRADILPKGALRRQFWSDYLDQVVPDILASTASVKSIKSQDQSRLETQLTQGLEFLLAEFQHRQNGDRMRAPKPSVNAIEVYVEDLGLLTRKAMGMIHDADVVVHDASIPSAVLELTRRESKRLSIAEMPRHLVMSEIIAEHQHGQSIVYLYAYGSSPMINASLFSEAGISVETSLAFPQLDKTGSWLAKPYQKNHIALKPIALKEVS